MQRNRTKEKIHEIIFEAETPMGKLFDIVLLVLIFLSVVVVCLETVERYQIKYGFWFDVLEWGFTIFFTIEYLLRLYSVYRPSRYATSFFGIIDLLAILPTYLSFIFTGSEYFIMIRALRLLRIFRIFKMNQYMDESGTIMRALVASRRKIAVFLYFILLMVIIIGALMYLVEGGENPQFTSIPRSIYWSIVTLTTVGYGDISPITELGQFLSAIVMILGYAVIAVPTGIVSSEMVRESRDSSSYNTKCCNHCGKEGHLSDAVFCRNCGSPLK